MHRAIRTQVDDRGDEYSAKTAMSFAGRDRARQEFKQEADVNYVFQRFGAGGILDPRNGRQARYEETDYTLDLQNAMASIKEAEKLYTNLPPEVRELFSDWIDVMKAANDGSLKQILDERKKPLDKRETPPHITSTPATPPDTPKPKE